MSIFISFSGDTSPLRQKATIALGEILRDATLTGMRLEGTKDVETVIRLEVPAWLFAAVAAAQGTQFPTVLGRPIFPTDPNIPGDVVRVVFADSVQAANESIATHHHQLLMLPLDPTAGDWCETDLAAKGRT